MNLCMVKPLMGLWHLLHALEAEPCFCSLGSPSSSSSTSCDCFPRLPQAVGAFLPNLPTYGSVERILVQISPHQTKRNKVVSERRN
ncbi:hypothetical protein BJ166DRAFT_136446 [Pestalotiopsis sp. NC0098]|nr:hypothetical protein BJ166DRAFT_136446 [Pestalotiopsis sp. NC0098]